MKIKSLSTFLLFILSFVILPLAKAQYNKLFDFVSITNGKSPYGSLISDGTFLYGMANQGGTSDMGILFKVKPDGTGYSTLLEFTGIANGSKPQGSLIYDGTFFYGMTTFGGINDKGTIFKVKPDGTAYSKLLDFAGASNGSNPQGSLIYDGTFLYGMTADGGINNKGTIFKIKSDGTGYSKLLDFSGITNGQYPYGSLISDGTHLYGMTYRGGTNNIGTIFKIKPDGTGYSKLLDFTGTANGSNPYGSLISDGTYLYGMTYYGGTNNKGIVFKINPDGTGFSILVNFSGAANGRFPLGSLISDGTFLYGMTMGGGISDMGVVFKVKADGSGYSKLLDFSSGAVNGSNPNGDLMLDGTHLYGVTIGGGAGGYGILFKIQPNGSGYSNLFDFSGAVKGNNPTGDLISDGTFLYGMTPSGGANNQGTIFKIKPDGTGYDSILNFSGANGATPYGSLIYDGTYLYGMTMSGGTKTFGTIFKIKPDGTGYVKLHDFAGSPADGEGPRGSLIYDGTYLYGMTYYGGINGVGTIFKIQPDGTGYSKLYDFSLANGDYPTASLISDGTYFYGMTSNGGPANHGTVFKIKMDGTGYSNLLNLPSGSFGGDCASLISDGTFLYGMTYQGGVNGEGTVFKIKPDGSGYSMLFDFSGPGNGSDPTGSLIYDGTFLYGVTSRGGKKGGGTIFKIQTDGSGHCKFFDFENDTLHGYYPYGSLISDGTYLYGMTYGGGTSDLGAIFKYGLAGAASVMGNTTICIGQSATLTASGGTNYSWSTGNTATTIIVSPTANTTYTVTATTGTCVATAIVTVIINTIFPIVSIAGNTSICPGQSATLNASGGTTYSWNTGATKTSIVVTPTATTNYKVIGFIGACTDTDNVIVTVDSLSVSLKLVKDTINPLLWYAYPAITGTTPFTYYWNFGDGNTSTLPNPSHTYTVAGQYAICLTVTDANGCSRTNCDSVYKISTPPGMIQYLVVINPFVTGTENLQITSEINIYPNPTDGFIYISYPSYTEEIFVVDIVARRVFNVIKSETRIDLSVVPAGIYFLHVKTPTGVLVRKIVKE